MCESEDDALTEINAEKPQIPHTRLHVCLFVCVLHTDTTWKHELFGSSYRVTPHYPLSIALCVPRSVDLYY